MLVLRAMFTLVGVAGLLLLAFAARFVSTNLRFLRVGVRTEATVVSSFRRRLVRGHQDWARFRFRLGDRDHQAEAEVHRRYAEGARITIAALPSAPEQVLVLHWFGTWWRPVLLFGFGALLSWLGFAQFFR